ncbi:MAG: CCA tRNA nucleotidyltransferase [Clostridiales bacterium]|uniref:CCA tRNA nucleotidyltransferase n=1 Tax=Terrisporobacter sp. TaxID=1965305 RepID=UPI002A49381F|nr:CCA tRNA nucleotidyltransferase [Terrisporobacter sp.]MCI5630480.1 CCA tRNA nucleotidyltransferase [Clostridium sp.]MDD5878426.1 CCA tRNA nucleotidyltransferase [Clostridiales bacterium]MCI6459560.1 CCA tRNA nucleotidyltransferase [Clostridium sp.]MCI7206335.1 CCA tRNA nucleotidyltransferase [Clostridium sp.]MDD7754981.1 CCA tRNA nucleotidyltransferase [Clostridiales bacterium]
MKINLPPKVRYIINKIYENNYEAYIVGGCVRDAILGFEPNDYDITTSASPNTIQEIFKDFKCIETGIEHGTVSVVIEDEIFEITTYRIEGEYKDHRRPDKVDFTDRLEEDLKRRDFTINAMAYNEKKGLIDLFGGKEDLNNKIIKTVGNPYDRFNEDGLRMIRAIRFSSKLNFTIEKETLKAIYDKSFIINNISLERITDEFTKIILSDKPENIKYLFETKLLKYLNISNEDDIGKLKQFYNEIVILKKINKNLEKRLALLDYIVEKNNINCKSFCNELIYSKKIIKNHNIILTLLKNIEIDHLNKVEIKKILSGVDRNLLEEYLDISRIIYDKEKKVDEIIDILSEIEENNECYIIKNLKVNGRDIMSLGYKNKEVGEVLNYLLEIVIEDYTLNKKDVLIKKIKEI